jgi:hypothetical protein
VVDYYLCDNAALLFCCIPFYSTARHCTLARSCRHLLTLLLRWVCAAPGRSRCHQDNRAGPVFSLTGDDKPRFHSEREPRSFRANVARARTLSPEHPQRLAGPVHRSERGRPHARGAAEMTAMRSRLVVFSIGLASLLRTRRAQADCAQAGTFCLD